MTSYRLNLPATDRAFDSHGLFRWFKFPVGNAIVRRGTSWAFHPAISDSDVAGADQYFLGGHDHIIDQATRDSLVAAGFGAFVSGA